MKKLFNRTRKPDQGREDFDKSIYDWDADEESVEEEYYIEEQYVEEEEIEGEYTGEEEIEEQYAEEEEIEGEYTGEEEIEEQYAEEEEIEEQYAEEEEIEEQYAEEGEIEEQYAGEDSGEAYYIEDDGEDGQWEYDAEAEDQEYSLEEQSLEDVKQRGREQKAPAPRPKTGSKGALQRRLRSMTVMDRVIMGTGAAILIIALVISGLYVSRGSTAGPKSEFADVGMELDGITVIGEKGLLAVADAQIARIAAAQVVEEEEDKTYDEAEYQRQVTVVMRMTSIQRDLKIKFVDQKTNKLVANVPFAVHVTDPDGKTSIWSDDDMDGIIYKKDIAPGTYKVSMEKPTDEKYADYIISTDEVSAEVNKDISYRKVDVSDEVKKESEINAAAEDTKIQDTIVESTLQDTVAWVESRVIGAAYNEVPKSAIPDPMTLALHKSFQRMAAVAGISESAKTLRTGESFTLTARIQAESAEENVTIEKIIWTSSNPAVAAVDAETGIVTAVSEGTASISYKASVVTGSSVSSSDAAESRTEVTGTCMVTVSGKAVVLDQTALGIPVGGTAAVQASVSGFGADEKLTYTVSFDKADVAKAEADANGRITVTGLTAGSTNMTVTVAGGTSSASASIPVTVGEGRQISLDKTTATVYMTVPVTINAVVTGAGSGEISVTAQSSDTTVALVSVNKSAVTITGQKAGSATITVKHTENGAEVQAVCTVTVREHPQNDVTSRLKDSNGNELYVLENNEYRGAVYADYYKAEHFFIKGEVRYSGWQNLGGKVYYFTAEGNAVTGEQVIQGARYNFASDGSLVTGNGSFGIDVSKWNGTIDWTAVKNSGVSYVIIRSGYRGSSQGTLVEDPKFSANIKGATAAGLKVGIYFFTQAVDEREAVEEASMVLEQVRNYAISYPIFLDVEASGGRADSISRETRTAVCRAFCQTIQSAGYTAGIYANKTWLETKINASELSAYKIWLAQYAAAPTYTGRYDLWQYRATGSVSGISGNVDLNLSYLGY